MTTFAIDFDGTLDAAPEAWSAWFRALNKEQHRVHCITQRRKTNDSEKAINAYLTRWDMPMPVIHTNGASKLWAVEQIGLKIDVWIDDNPRALVEGI